MSRPKAGMPKSDSAATGGRNVAPEDADTLYYLHCVVESGTEAHRLIESGSIDGMEQGEAVFPIVVGELVAAVSRVPRTRFDTQPLNDALGDLTTAAPLAASHDRALTQLLDAAPAVVPISLGAVFHTTAPIENLLRVESRGIRAILTRLSGRQEWGVKVFEQSDQAADSALQDSEELKELDAQIEAAGPGRRFLLGKQRRKVAVQATARLRSKQLDHVVDSLERVTAALKPDRLIQPPSESARLVLKLACLVERTNVGAFLDRVAALKAPLEALGQELQVTGPWAPYSFADIGDIPGSGRHDQ